jgi:hypothetical protein
MLVDIGLIIVLHQRPVNTCVGGVMAGPTTADEIEAHPTEIADVDGYTVPTSVAD